jgi:hypothetical protein
MWFCRNRALLEELLQDVREILARLPKPPRTTSIAVESPGAAMNSLVLNVGQSSIATIVPLEADGVTQTPGAVVSAQTFTISDPSLTLTPNADGTATIAGVAASTGTISGTASATITDLDGAVAAFTQIFTVTVNAVVVGLTTQIGVSFSTPQ